MGAETSKIEAPQEFGQSGNGFQILSPMSELSCPSDIHRINRLRAEDRSRVPSTSDPSRRMSKTVTKTLHRSQKPSSSGVPPPSHFYFPTKETEKAVERAERKGLQSEKENERPKIIEKTKKMLKKTQKAMTGCFAEDHAVQLEEAQRMEEAKHHPTLGIARKVLPPKASSSKHVDEYDAKPQQRRTRSSSAKAEAETDSQPVVESAKKAAPVSFAQVALHQADDYFTRLTMGSADESPYVQNKAFQREVPSALGKDEPDSPLSALSLEEKNGPTSIDSIIESSLAESDVQRNRHSLSSTVSDQEKGFLSPSNSVLQYQRAIGTVAETPGYYPEDDDDDSDPVFSDDVNEEVQDQGQLATIAEKGDDESSALSDNNSKNKNTISAFRPRNSLRSQKTEQSVLALATYNASGEKVSKLESLFRPVLPALSADDAQTAGSYDQWEIKVTESAPSVMETTDYRSMAMRHGSPEHQNMTALEKKLGGFSPSMMSIDSQVNVSPAMSKQTVSNQARDNGEFLFAADGKESEHLLKLKARAERDNDHFSINTIGARSRLSNRVGAKAVAIPDMASMMDDQSQYSKDSSRRVRFSLLDAVSASVGLAPKESIDVPTIEGTLSDLTDGRRSSHSGVAKKSSSLETVPLTSVGSYKNNGVKSNSPYLRFQSAKTKFQSEAFVEVPAIQNKVSDLTDTNRSSIESGKSIPQDVAEEAESKTPEPVSGDSPMQVHWSYSLKDGDLSAVTPHFSRGAKQATKSPYIRFENAKNKFSGNPADTTALVKKETALVKKDTALVKKKTSIVKKETALVKKSAPFKSPRSSRPVKVSRPLKSGGSVANKIQELNQRVVDAKIDRKAHRWLKSNPRKYGVIASNAVRTRAIASYKTDVVGIERINYMSAAKFNSIPIDDDSSVDSSIAESYKSKKSVTFAEPEPLLNLTSGPHTHEEYDDDEASKLSTDDMSKLTADSSIATLRQAHYSMPNNYSTTARISEGTYSTASSGFTNVKKQVFRGSVSTSGRSRLSTSGRSHRSISSHGGSTTMSSILDKENSTFQFRANANTVKPTEQTIVVKPDQTSGQAQTWRTLAAAAHLRDSEKKQTRKGLAVKNGNKLAIA
jgi:hypothetical protein